jgi:hypothetical protein
LPTNGSALRKLDSTFNAVNQDRAPAAGARSRDLLTGPDLRACRRSGPGADRGRGAVALAGTHLIADQTADRRPAEHLTRALDLSVRFGISRATRDGERCDGDERCCSDHRNLLT